MTARKTMATNRTRATAGWAFVGVLTLFLILFLAGYDPQTNQAVSDPPASMPTAVVYKSPTCGCCTGWGEHLRANGFEVDVRETDRMEPVKQRLGIPRNMVSCHTAVIGDYVIEGHVRAADIQRLLQEKPDAKGLAVPGMPLGSPGMEAGNRRQPYTVWLLQGNQAPRSTAIRWATNPDSGRGQKQPRARRRIVYAADTGRHENWRGP
jgi:hypothetical protein